MHIRFQSWWKWCAPFCVLLAMDASAQTISTPNESSVAPTPENKASAQQAVVQQAVEKKLPNQKLENETAQPVKKMVQNATISLQTTVTGNQEQPRVLYILPWQSPMTADVDFEALDNEQKAVFGHVEREELRRELESAGQSDK